MIRALKRVVITGGLGGLGCSIAKEFRAHGWDVIALGHSDFDVTDAEVVRDYFSKVVCDLLICCAGVVKDTPLLRMDEATWDHVFGVNFFGAESCALAAIEGMITKGGGHVVFVSSYAALHPEIGQAAYATAKAGLLGLTRDLAKRYGSQGVRVNAILPGFLETRMTEGVSERRRQEVLESHLLGELNCIANVARFVRFLEEELPFTSGQVFQLDSRL